jgi:hypothetical protein
MDYAALKAAIVSLTDPEFVADREAGNTGAMAEWFNVDTSEDVWKPVVSITELLNSVVWSEFVALPQEKRDAWFALTQGGAEGVDATVAAVREGFVTIFGVSQSVLNLEAAAQRKATRYESVYTVDGVCSEFGYRVTNEDIVRALAL